ncbi:MAG TPA: UDP-N-acetylmuramoyl-tripeptide--D-alanyl-D-alanine ligase [Ilumatobacteraceae bacterium]|nr:UDP-N-acetylmuramoyl-tripeptide--D-alanyl-D-alanine ligase [Ilumatobacteraceae bacterium]
MRIRASDAAAGIGGRLVGPDVELTGVSFDSRSTRPGELFVPIVAARDGHEFIGDARLAGAVAHLTSRPDEFIGDGTAIEVADTAQALLALAAWARPRLDAAVVGVTGSVGKTTTKDMIAAACGAGRRTTANERSFNNDQGLPVTILNAPDDTEVLVVEMGMRGFGEIARLCRIARPDIGVVTVVGHAHTDLVGGLEGVSTAKGELVEALPASGTAILNADDERVAAMASRSGASVLTFGWAGDVFPADVELDAAARAHFVAHSPWGRAEVTLPVPGMHMVSNALAALAVAGTVGVDIDAAAATLAGVEVSGMRMEVVTAPSGATIVNDAYNANPTSMHAALDALAAIDTARRIAVIGLMAEIEDAERAHREILRRARDLDLEVVVVGTDLYGVAPVDDVRAAIGSLDPDTAVLVKASRAAGLERVVADLLAR